MLMLVSAVQYITVLALGKSKMVFLPKDSCSESFIAQSFIWMKNSNTMYIILVMLMYDTRPVLYV